MVDPARVRAPRPLSAAVGSAARARTPLLLFLLALVWHTGWALAGPAPVDWDPSYYRALAARLAAGGAAEAWSVWNLSWLPASLPYPADLHWMPLPSRVLVPFLWAWPDIGDRIASVLLASGLAPIAWALARRLGGGPRAALLAAALAGSGLQYGWMLTVPDSIAPYALLGGLGALAVADGRVAAAALVAAAAAWTRNDGFLLGPCLALALSRPRDMLVVAVAGPVAAAAWHLRNLGVLGDEYAALRAAATGALHLDAFVLGVASEAGMAARARVVGPALAQGYALLWLAWLPLPAVFVALWRPAGWVRGWLAYAVVFPAIAVSLAPGVAESGTLFRSGSALFAGGCALAAVGLTRLGRLAAAKRGYPEALVPLLASGALLVVGVFAGPITYVRYLGAGSSDVCAPLVDVPPDAVVFSSNPLRVEAACGRRGVVRPPGLDDARVEALAARYDVRYALLLAADEAPPAGWSRRRERLWVRSTPRP